MRKSVVEISKNDSVMKKSTLFILFFCSVFLNAQKLTNVIGLPEGFASMNGGVTGGEGGPVITVTTGDELRAAVDGTNTAAIVLVKGKINVVGEIPARGNKTIVGLGTDAHIAGGGFGWNTKSNVIVQNLTFSDAPDDLLKINNKCMNFWIDHCTFSDGASTNAGSHDGMLDVTRGSQYVTISYNKFFQHDKNILIGHSDSETGDVNMKVTLHHNWFDGTVQRNPRVRYATVHCYNNYYVANSIYSVASACNANVLVENCYFKDAPIPLQVGVPGFSPEGYLVQKGCIFDNCGTPQTKDKDMTGLFPYTYVLDSAKYVPCIAETFVGATKPSRTPGLVDCTAVDTGNGGETDTIPDTNGCVWLKNDLFAPDTDAENWFWFYNETSSAKFLPSIISLLPSVSSAGVTSTLQTVKLGAGTDGTAGSAGALIGCIDLGKSATKGDFTGGAAIFQLPSCGEFQLTTSRTGDNAFNVMTATSADGPFTQQYTYTGAKGISKINLSQYVQTENPVWIKITNGSNGSLNIHGVLAKSYIKDCSNGVKHVVEKDSKLSFIANVLTFSSKTTCPAEISILTLDGRVIDIPFRGWLETNVDNKITLNMSHLNKGLYVIKLSTNQGSVSLKFLK